MNLNWSEVQVVCMVGAMRRLKAIQRARSEPHGTPETGLWGNEVESCGAELVVSKAVNQRWNFEIVGSLLEKPPDVGNDIEVRWTRHPNGVLYVHADDPPERWYFLVTGWLPDYEIRGYIWGNQAMQGGLWKPTPRGNWAYHVEQGDLL